MLFDTHAHVLSPDVGRYPYSALRGGNRPPVTPVVFTVDDLLQAMDACGVAQACLVQRATLYGYDNRYVLDAAAAHRARLAPIVVLDAEDAQAPAQLRALAREHDIAGLRLVAPRLTVDETDWLDGAAALQVWQVAAALALPVTVILYRMNHAAALTALYGIASRHHDLPILIDHVGVPHASTPETRYAASQGVEYGIPPPPDFGIADSVARFDALPLVHFKITDINFDRLEDAGFDAALFVRALADRFGAARLLWGSDVGQSPAPYAEKVARLRAAARLLTEVERAQVFHGTARQLYGRALQA